MLEELSVRNYALIENAVIGFKEGLNVLSGETGAGKSILAGCLGLILGSKADADVIRTGRDEAEVSAVVAVGGSAEALRWLKDRDIAADEGQVTLRRVLRRSGRNASYIQSAPMAIADIQDFASLLFDLHGQHEHQALFNIDNHRRFLDAFAGLEARVAAFSGLFNELNSLKKNLEELAAREKSRREERELLAHAVEEIGAAALKPGEEEELQAERKRHNEHGKLVALLEETMAALAESRGGALSSLKRAGSGLNGLAGIDPALRALAERAESARYEMEDIAESLKDYQSRLSFDPQRLEEVEERLLLLKRLGKKYGPSLDEMLRYRESALEKLRAIDNLDEEKKSLTAAIQEKEKRAGAEALSISAQRKEHAERLEKEIVEGLQRLGMKKIRFKIQLARKESDKGGLVVGPWGFDVVSFEISPNPGEPLKPLRNIASGGEISRVMLAIRTALAETDHVECLVFDEIDAGIGGEVGIAVGEYLKRLSKGRQVLCITHLASIAARADHHLKVEKRVEEGRTMTDISRVEGSDRVREVARMLSGDPEEQSALSHAEDLLRKFQTADQPGKA